jgi:hypothetical protein
MGAAAEVAGATQYRWFSSGSCAIFRISEHHGTSKHLQTARVLSAQARKAGNVESCLTSTVRHGSAVVVAFR